MKRVLFNYFKNNTSSPLFYSETCNLLPFIWNDITYKIATLIASENAPITVYVSSIYYQNQDETRSQVNQSTLLHWNDTIAFEWPLNFPFATTDGRYKFKFSLGERSMTECFVHFYQHGAVNGPIKYLPISDALVTALLSQNGAGKC